MKAGGPVAPAGPPGEAPVRVLIACDHIDFDGALHGGGRQLIELLHALDRRRVEPTACVLRAPSPLGLALQRDGLPLRFFADGRYNPASLLRLLGVLRSQRIQVMHLTDFGASTLGRVAGRLAGVPAIVQVITHHSEHTYRRFPPHVALAYRALAPGTARALAISESVRAFAIRRMGFARAQVEVLHYPLPRHSFSATASPEDVQAVRERHGLRPEHRVVGAVTRFFPVKGIRYLIEAFEDILRGEPDARLVLVGKGPEEAALQAQAAALGLDAHVVFAGFQRNVEHYVAAFDVAVVPSLEEAFGLVAVEAMALGIPVVASRVDGLQEVVTHERSGLLVEPASPQAIAGAVLRLLRDDALRQRLGASARIEAQRFALDRYAGRLTQLYQELAAAGAARKRKAVPA